MKVKELTISRKHNLQKIKLAYESLEIGITTEVEDALLEEEVKAAYLTLEKIWRKFNELYATGAIQ